MDQPIITKLYENYQLNDDGDDNEQAGCKLMDSFAVIIQLLLASLAFSTLIFKRQQEKPQRPLLIWGFDVSKQVIGAGVIHALNIIVSYIKRDQNSGEGSNPCVWYFLNILIDTTIGVFILWCIIQSLNRLVTRIGIEELRSGDYGEPPLQDQIYRWSKQLFMFILALILMKLVVLGIFRICPFLVDVGRWALAWTMGNTRLQVVFVMLVFPLIMNIIQFWLVDTIVKNKLDKVMALPKDEEESGLRYDEDDPSTLTRAKPTTPLLHSRGFDTDELGDDENQALLRESQDDLAGSTLGLRHGTVSSTYSQYELESSLKKLINWGSSRKA
ncbi:uncharacterized protein VTP21DRAFT_11095 [Calcarisporiella thermophila]|uniref:uncharacterized protein n=1 Tax=Calcarisporiella thermophila TaxID=911321 RepID=UPI0037435B13